MATDLTLNPLGDSETRRVLEQAAERYVPLGRSAAGWARGKLLRDPVYRAVLPFIPHSGLFVDIGCGEGYLMTAARICRPRATLFGCDHDAKRLRQASEVLGGDSDCTIAHADVRHIDIPDAATIAMLDVLHYLPVIDQDALVTRAAAAINPGGVLLIRDIEPGHGLRSFAATLAERLGQAFGRHRGDGLHFRPIAETAAVCEQAGLAVTIRPCEQGTPFANRLLIATRSD